MKTRRGLMTGITVVAMLGSVASLDSNVAQQSNSVRSVEQYSCKEVMREHGADRDVMIAFLHGFLLGKSGSETFDAAAFHRQTREFINVCLDSPTDKAVDVMVRVKG